MGTSNEKFRGIYAATPDPDAITEAEGIRALSSELKEIKGVKNTKGVKRLLTNNVENGTYIVTYTFDALRRANSGFHPFGIGDDVSDIKKLNQEERTAVQKALKQIERVANIHFREAEGDQNIIKADIRYFKGKFENPNDSGQTTTGTFLHYISDIILKSSDSANNETILHETLHALGLSHPYANGAGKKSGGKNPYFNQTTTVMSYYPGEVMADGLGAFDVATLQYHYGKSHIPSSPLVNVTTIENKKYLTADKPLTVDVRNSIAPGQLHIDENGITGFFEHKLQSSPDGEIHKTRVKMRNVGDTKIKDILAGTDTKTDLFLTGNELTNTLQGGSGNDELTPRGGLDRLTGGKGWDIFTLDEKSGHGNFITDFNAKEKDEIKLRGPVSNVSLCYIDGILLEGKCYKGTELWARDANGESVASAKILGATPKEIRDHILPPQDGAVAITTIQDAPPEEPVTPPVGLPLMPWLLSATRKREK